MKPCEIWTINDKPLLQTESFEEELNNQLIWHTNDFIREFKFSE